MTQMLKPKPHHEPFDIWLKEVRTRLKKEDVALTTVNDYAHLLLTLFVHYVPIHKVVEGIARAEINHTRRRLKQIKKESKCSK